MTDHHDLGLVMREHDVEAPEARTFVPYVRRPNRGAVLAAALTPLAIIAIVALAISYASGLRDQAGHDHPIANSSAPAAPDCSRGPDAAGPRRTVLPDRAPDAVSVCAYTHGRLVDARAVTGDLSAVTLDFAAQLRTVTHGHQRVGAACEVPIAASDIDLVVDARYGSQVTRIDAGGAHCGPTSLLHAAAVQGLSFGDWPSNPTLDRECARQPRPGDSATLPAHPSSVTICLPHAGGYDVYRYTDATSWLVTLPSTAVLNRQLGRADEPCPLLVARSAVVATFVARNGASTTLLATTTCVRGPADRSTAGGSAARIVESLMYAFVLAT